MMNGPEKSDPVIVAGKPTKSGAIRSGVGGAKDRDQGECGPTKHVPDSEPDKRGTRCWLAYGSVVSSIPEVGAVCGKAARTDLCGGREATRVPTAKTQAPVWAADGPRQRAQARVHHLTGS